MKYRINIPREAQSMLQAMAQEAGVDVNSLIEISVYNLIALWVKDKDKSDYIQPFDSNDAVAPNDKLVV